MIVSSNTFNTPKGHQALSPRHRLGYEGIASRALKGQKGVEFVPFSSSDQIAIQQMQVLEELEQDITCAKFAHMGTEGDQQYEYTAYNLDVIISVGYRVKSKHGTKFRQWANKVLKEYLLRGYVINTRIAALEQHAAKQDVEIQALKSKVDFFVRTSLPPVEGVFFDGQIFDAYAQIVSLIRQAKASVVLVDNYIDESTLTMLSRRGTGVTATIYTRPLNTQQQLDVQRHNQQYPPIAINICQHNHDRFLIIDDEVYVFGASLKDAGKRLFAYIRMQETSATNLLAGIR